MPGKSRLAVLLCCLRKLARQHEKRSFCTLCRLWSAQSPAQVVMMDLAAPSMDVLLQKWNTSWSSASCHPEAWQRVRPAGSARNPSNNDNLVQAQTVWLGVLRRRGLHNPVAGQEQSGRCSKQANRQASISVFASNTN